LARWTSLSGRREPDGEDEPAEGDGPRHVRQSLAQEGLDPVTDDVLIAKADDAATRPMPGMTAQRFLDHSVEWSDLGQPLTWRLG
jgi:hypothetical protein